jgi:hypothetical protein
MSQGEEKVPQIQDTNMAILQAIQGMMEMMRDDRQEGEHNNKEKNEPCKKIKECLI